MAKSGQGLAVLLGLGAAGAIAYAVLSKPSTAAAQPPALPGGNPPCDLDANIPPAWAQQINAALNATGVPSATYTQLASLAAQNNFPKAAACLTQAAARASANAGLFGLNQSAATNNAIGQALGNQNVSLPLQRFISSGLASALSGQPSPVDWSNLNTNLLNQIAALKTLGYSSADALAIANYMQQGMTQAQAIAAWQQAQSQPSPAPSATSWQTQAQNQLMLAGWPASSASATAFQLTDAQARYLTRLIKHSVSANDALVQAQSGAGFLNQESGIESGLSPSQLTALNTLIVNAWEADNITTPRVTADRPPTPAQELTVTQLAANLTGQKADFFNQLISTGSGVREAYTQVTGDSNFPKG